jgi:erythronate-4-phosphate dehydrogenase
MNQIKIVADNKIPFLRGVLEPFAEISYLEPSQISKDTVKDVDALIIRTRTKCNKDLLDNSNVKFIATATIGFDHIDTVYCQSKAIEWISAPGCNSSSVQQYIASALLTLAKEKSIQLDKNTLGIVGVGNVGSKIEKLGNILGMNVLLNDPPRERIEGSEKYVSLDHLIEQSDIITFHVPLNKIGIDKTLHLANHDLFEKFNDGKVFLNTSRGEVVKTDSLKRAIKNKKVFACTLDVWENEPDIDIELLNLVDIATPHIAGYATEGKANGTAACVNALNDFFNLGLKQNWYPNNLPVSTKEKEIKIECAGKSKQEIFFECINSTHNIKEDDKRLRESASSFERQRAEYPVRREFNYYDVHLNNAEESIKKAINDLGFNIKNK